MTVHGIADMRRLRTACDEPITRRPRGRLSTSSYRDKVTCGECLERLPQGSCLNCAFWSLSRYTWRGTTDGYCRYGWPLMQMSIGGALYSDNQLLSGSAAHRRLCGAWKRKRA